MDYDDIEFSLEIREPTTVIQNISTLDLTVFRSNDDRQMSEIFTASEPVIQKNDFVGKREGNRAEARSSSEEAANQISYRDLKIISVEIEYLKQAVGLLQSQMNVKSMEIRAKDQTIEKLEKVIGKHKKKMKELKIKVAFQEAKLGSLEENLPKYYELIEKCKAQEACKVTLDEKHAKLEKLLCDINAKRNKI